MIKFLLVLILATSVSTVSFAGNAKNRKPAQSSDECKFALNASSGKQEGNQACIDKLNHASVQMAVVSGLVKAFELQGSTACSLTSKATTIVNDPAIGWAGTLTFTCKQHGDKTAGSLQNLTIVGAFGPREDGSVSYTVSSASIQGVGDEGN